MQPPKFHIQCSDVIMGTLASQIINLTIVYSTFCSDADQRKHQSSASLAFERGNHWGSVNSPQKWPVTRKMFPFDDVIMIVASWGKSTEGYPERFHVMTSSYHRLTPIQHWVSNMLSYLSTLAFKHQGLSPPTWSSANTCLVKFVTSVWQFKITFRTMKKLLVNLTRTDSFMA